MEFIIENLSQEEIDIMESSTIDWCPDYIGSNRRDIIVFFRKRQRCSY